MVEAEVVVEKAEVEMEAVGKMAIKLQPKLLLRLTLMLLVLLFVLLRRFNALLSMS